MGYTFANHTTTVSAICAAIDARRDALLDGGFTFDGHPYQSRPADREAISDAAHLARAAIAEGAEPEDLRWRNPDADFVWIDAENALVELDAHQVVGLFTACHDRREALTLYARALKDAVINAADPAAVDITSGWPEA